MATKSELGTLKVYINQNWNMYPYEGKKAIEKMDHFHYPLSMANRELYEYLWSLICDFATDNDYPDNWVDNIEIEDIFFECDCIFGD